MKRSTASKLGYATAMVIMTYEMVKLFLVAVEEALRISSYDNSRFIAGIIIVIWCSYRTGLFNTKK